MVSGLESILEGHNFVSLWSWFGFRLPAFSLSNLQFTVFVEDVLFDLLVLSFHV